MLSARCQGRQNPQHVRDSAVKNQVKLLKMNEEHKFDTSRVANRDKGSLMDTKHKHKSQNISKIVCFLIKKAVCRFTLSASNHLCWWLNQTGWGRCCGPVERKLHTPEQDNMWAPDSPTDEAGWSNETESDVTQRFQQLCTVGELYDCQI